MGILNNEGGTQTNFLTERVNLYEEYINDLSGGRYNKVFKSEENNGSSSTSSSNTTKPTPKNKTKATSKNKTKTTPTPTPTPNTIARFICKILLNTISLKSLGDLVPYYFSLIRIMEEKPKLPETYKYLKEELTHYFMNFQSVQNHFLGFVNSGDYSLVQIAGIYLSFQKDNGDVDLIRQQMVENTEMLSSVHISQSDIILPCSEKSKNIFRLMSSIANGSAFILSLFDYTQTNSFNGKTTRQNAVTSLYNTKELIDFMNITETIKEIHRIKSQIYILLKDYKEIVILSNSGTDIIAECETLIKTINDYLLDQGLEDEHLNLNCDSLLLKIKYFKLFINKILILNEQIAKINVDNFFMKLNDDSIPYKENIEIVGPKRNYNSNVTIDNPNLYFLCEYIIRNLYEKKQSTTDANETTQSNTKSQDASSNTFLTSSGHRSDVQFGYAKGGKPNKSSKFKTTKKNNKKQYKKKTRKY